MNRHKERWKQKKRWHDHWVQNAKEANKVLDVPNTFDNPPTPLFPIPHQLPTCPGQDDGACMLFYQVEETGNGYRIHIICVLCLQKGKQ